MFERGLDVKWEGCTMRKSVKDVVIALVVVTAMAGAPLLDAGGQEPAAKLAQPEKPASIEAYERLVAELEGRPIEEPAQPIFKPFPEDAKDIVGGYDRLFKGMQPPVDAFAIETGDLLSRGPHEWTDWDKARIGKFLEAHQDLLREMRRMAERGAPVYPLDFSKAYGMDRPHLARVRKCARVLRASAVVNGMNGNYAEAAADVIAGMRIADALAREPILISQLVRITIYVLIMNDAVQKSFEGGDLSPELTQRLMAHLAQADHREEFAESLAGERYLFGRKALSTYSMRRSGAWSGFLGASDLGPLQEVDEQAYDEIMNRIASAARLPYYEAARELSQIQNDIESLPRTLAYSRHLLPFLARTCEAQARHESVVDLMQLGILVEQYRAREGWYPRRLDDIGPHLGGSLPVDPFSGERYHYRPLGETFLLYSIGENRRDDGGTHDYRKGDIVWRGEARK